MKKSIKEALEDASAVMEEIKGKLPTMTLQEKVDVAARLKGVAKHAEAIDKAVKEDIKAKLKSKPGTVLGEVFKAILALVPTDRLNQKALKEEEPEIVARFTETEDQQRITFEPR
jgi:hypothetical protein